MVFQLPGPGAYEAKNFMQEDPSFPAGYFQRTVRPFNKISIRSQVERVEDVADRCVKDQFLVVPEFKGCKKSLCFIINLDESSLGMKVSRVSGVGRRIRSQIGNDDENLPFADKPGFTWGNTIRADPTLVSSSALIILVDARANKIVAQVQLFPTPKDNLNQTSY